jgi:hypothetical protein
MYIYIYIHTFIHTYLLTYIHTYVYTYTYVHMYTYTYTHTHTHTYIYIYIYIGGESPLAARLDNHVVLATRGSIQHQWQRGAQILKKVLSTLTLCSRDTDFSEFRRRYKKNTRALTFQNFAGDRHRLVDVVAPGRRA